MKKITLLLLFLIVSVSGYSQLTTQGFETPGPLGPPPTTWTLGSPEGDWAVFDNGVGTVQSWGINTVVAPPHQGVNFASVSWENVGAGNTSEDYLATPAVHINDTGGTELHFWTRLFTSGDQGTTFKIMVAPAIPGEQMNISNYVDWTTWSEQDLIVPTSNFNVWTEKTVDLSGLAGFDVYIAFVKVYAQPSATLNGDRWLIDDVGINAPCLAPVAGTATAVTSTTASVSWTGSGTSFHIIVTPVAGGTPLTFDTTSSPFTVTGLTPNTQYNYTVTATCSTGFSSDPSGASPNFTTQIAPPVCGGNLVDSGGTGGNYSNNENTTPITVTPTAGNVVTVTFTAFNTEAGNDILRIYNGPSTASPLLATLSGATLPPSYTSTAPGGELTFQFTSNATTTAAGYAANITCGPAPACRVPADALLQPGSVTTTTAVINWTQPANPDSSVANMWDVIYLPQGSPAPNAGSTPSFDDISVAPPFTLTGLTPGTCYDVYVRAVCGASNSGWSAPLIRVCTLVAPPVCGGNFVDSGGSGANYSNNETLTYVIDPVTVGNAVTVTFTQFNTELNNDTLSIYDGPGSTGFPLLGTFSGTTLPPTFTSSDPSGKLTFVFTSNGTTTAAGWLANVTCAPLATCAAPTGLTASAILHNSITLTWNQPANPDSSVPNSWQVLPLPAGSAAPTASSTGFVTASNNPFVLNTTVYPALAPNTCYDIYVRAVCGSSTSAWTVVPATNVCTLIAPPECGGNFVDSGGIAANYANSENITTTICPTNPGDVVTVSFTAFDTEATWDALYVYNGIGTGGTLFASQNGAGNVPGGLPGGWWGTTIPCPFTSSSADGCLTFVFRSDGSVNRAGWVSNITCNPPSVCAAPNAIAANGTTFNSTNLTWTQPANADSSVATAWDIFYQACGQPAPTAATVPQIVATTINNPFPLTGLAPGTCYDIYVRANCGTNVSAWPCLPVSVTTSAAPPVCGGNFVDSGGTTANYQNSENITTTICPTTPGDVVTVTFTAFNTEATWDALYVYNGSTVNPANLIPSSNPAGNVPGGLAGGYWGTAIPCPFTSAAADGCLTFVFRSDGSVNNPGWVSNITCAPPPACSAPSSIVATNVRHNSASLSWTQPANGDGSFASAWDVFYQPCGQPAPTAASVPQIVATTNNPYSLTGLSPLTCYDIYVRANCGTGVSAWPCTPVTITTLATPPTCNEVFTDAGGTTGAYANNSNVPTYICPANPGDVVTVTFTSFNTEATVDGLYVYDGNAIGVNQISSNNGAGTVPGGLPGSYWGNLTGGALPGPFTSSTADGCLTFVFRSNGFTTAAGWTANVTCAPAPTCARPLQITHTATQTSATINWVQPANPNGSVATAWEILVLPYPSVAPVGAGIPVTGTPTFNATNLTAGTQYDVWIRAVCGPNDFSIWSPYSFATPPTNDECANAQFAIVNQNLNCVQTTHGTLVGATASNPPTTCGGAGAADNDVWFTFTATTITHIISFNNVTPAATLNYAIYSGTCGNLTEVGCNSGANLVAGTTYYIRVFSTGTGPQNSTFDMCIGTLPCTEAPAFCTGQTVTYANTTNVPSLGQIGCLFTSPNPAFFFLQVNNAGPLSYLISQVDANGVGRDVDYVAWGPFTDLNTACTGVPANPLTQTTPIPTPATGCPGTLHACSYSAAPQEIMCIPNAQLCEVYVIMITNFSNQPGTVTFTQTNSGGGTTACFPINTFNYAQTYYCQNQPNPTPTLAPGATAGTYTSTPGLVIDPATGTIDLLASTPGPYVVTSTTATTIGGTCSTIPFITTTRTVIITAPANATISYAGSPYCNTISTAQPVTQTGTTGGTYSATPTGLVINANTGDVYPSASQPGTYTVTYTVAATGGCAAFTTTAQVVIIDAPVPSFTQVAPICPGDPLADLPTSSNDATPITGTWSPAMNNTQTTTYTFTPDAGQCAENAYMTINVGSTIPTFDPVAPVCQGATIAALPTTSNNGITGIWSPAIDNTQTTTYTFTPTSGVCVGSTTLTIQILTPTIVPTFNAIPPICPNGTLSPLPTTSLNGITGTWSPALDNTQTTTYTFTPDTGQCGLPTTLEVVVNPPLVVTVNNPSFCPGSSATVVATPAIPGNYSYTWTVPTGASDPGNVASFTTTVPGTYSVVIDQVTNFCNTDFETPTATGTTPNLVNENLVPCWDTTASDGIIELWPPGFEGVTAYSGNQLAELNANQVGTLFQDFVVVPGTTISVSFAHRGRQGNDVVGVEIGPVGGPYVSLGNYTDGNTAWGLHAVNYTIPTGNGTNYTLRFVSVSSAGGSPSIGNLLDSISISSLSCTSAPATGVVSLDTLPAPTVTVTDPTCTVPTGTIEVTSPLNTGGLPANLFISEVTDSNAGALTYIEIFNGTGSPVDLSNYKLRTFNNGSSTVTGVCDNTLSGILANNDVHVVAVGTVTNQGGVTPDEVFASCTGVNFDDNIRLTTTANVDIDIWGTVDGTTFTPAGQPGYTYRRNNTAVAPSTTFNPADWTALDPEDYTNVGSYVPGNLTYEYSLDTGAYQSSTTFTGVSSGPHTITVHNLVTGCFSLPFDVTVGPIVGSTTPTFNFGTTLTICSGDAVPTLSTSSDDATPITGTWSPTVVDNTNSGTYTFTPSAGQCATTTTLTVTVTQPTTPTFAFGTTLSICAGDAVPTLPTSSNDATAITGSWSPTTVDNLNSGTYTFTPDAGQCATTTTFTVSVTQQTTPTFAFGTTLSICSGTVAPTLPTSSNNGTPITGTWSPATIDNVNNGVYTFTPDAGQCATTTTLTVTITAPTNVPTFPFGTTLTICSGNVAPTLPTTSDNAITGTWSPTTISNVNSGVYTFTPDAGQCATTATLTVTVTAPNTVPTFAFGTAASICPGDTGETLPTTSDNSITGSWSPAVVDNTNSGVYTFTPDPGQCAVSTTFTVTVVPPVLIELNGGCQDVYVLNATPVNGSFDPNTATFSWQNASGIEVGTGQSLDVPAIGVYTVVVTVNGCSTESATFDVTSIACQIQKGISVNNDGFNDTFDLTGFGVKKLTIFNRYGMKVYSKANYVNEWGGKSDDGNELPDGTYFYVIDLNAGGSKTGWIYINRAQ